MAKSTASKSKTKKPSKPAAKKASSPSIEKVSEQVLEKLRALKVEQGLQNDIEWCLGSYNHDKNPAGLYEMGSRALSVLKAAKEKNAKSVPATLITSLTKALAAK